MTRYEAVRSNTDKSLHVIFNDGEFAALPHRVRQLGPWQGLTGDDVERLKPHYRLMLAEQGFVLVYHGSRLSVSDRADYCAHSMSSDFHPQARTRAGPCHNFATMSEFYQRSERDAPR